ncbi:YjjG family noncanonical pyrimidine nucleotidase [Ascidiimonas sp. W6]|uniref:YjjG family noncanonical pyrimidine nucleotidase n=1 Tax=Ascidiimonas meishanensis TaxID=3128903 RepID=UPI0030EEA090
MKNTITDIFFDLDHTLWDFEKNSALTFETIFEEQNIQIALDEFLEVYVPLNFKYWKMYREEKISKSQLRYSRLKVSFDTLNFDVEDDLINDLSKRYIEVLPEQNNLFVNTVDILNYLRERYTLHIITNGFEEIQEKKLQNSAIRSFFQNVVNSEMVGVKKPNPRIFEFALNKAGVSAVKSVMVGDSLEADILGAKNVGMQTIHFNSTNDPIHEHGIIVKELLELKNYL